MNRRRLSTIVALILSTSLVLFFVKFTSRLPLTVGSDGIVTVPSPGVNFVAHSMGGLIAQEVLTEKGFLREDNETSASRPVAHTVFTGVVNDPSGIAEETSVAVHHSVRNHGSIITSPDEQSLSPLKANDASATSLTNSENDKDLPVGLALSARGSLVYVANRSDSAIFLVGRDGTVAEKIEEINYSGETPEHLTLSASSGTPIVLTHGMTGWHEISALSRPTQAESFTFKWRPRDPAEKYDWFKLSSPSSSVSFTLTVDSTDSIGNSLAWIYFDRPGTFSLVASTGSEAAHEKGLDPPVNVRVVTVEEFLQRLKDIGFVGVLVSMYLVRGLVLSFLWVLCVIALRKASYWVLQRLPMKERKQAENDITILLRVAEWGGVGSYTIWTIKDIAELALRY